MHTQSSAAHRLLLAHCTFPLLSLAREFTSQNVSAFAKAQFQNRVTFGREAVRFAMWQSPNQGTPRNVWLTDESGERSGSSGSSDDTVRTRCPLVDVQVENQRLTALISSALREHVRSKGSLSRISEESSLDAGDSDVFAEKWSSACLSEMPRLVTTAIHSLIKGSACHVICPLS